MYGLQVQSIFISGFGEDDDSEQEDKMADENGVREIEFITLEVW